MTYLIPFFQVDSELAAKETRTMNLLQPHDSIPAGSYGFLEFYCPDPDCDCRRVMINIVEKKCPTKFLASIGYGFDRQAEDAGPYLDSLNEQCSYAAPLMRLVERVALNDSNYVARLERHYALVKRAAVDPAHPASETLREATENEGGWLSIRTMNTLLGKTLKVSKNPWGLGDRPRIFEKIPQRRAGVPVRRQRQRGGSAGSVRDRCRTALCRSRPIWGGAPR